jgi:hypothetical protein
MELESYFTFLSNDDIRLQGTRIGIETILYAYVRLHGLGANFNPRRQVLFL